MSILYWTTSARQWKKDIIAAKVGICGQRGIAISGTEMFKISSLRIFVICTEISTVTKNEAQDKEARRIYSFLALRSKAI